MVLPELSTNAKKLLLNALVVAVAFILISVVVGPVIVPGPLLYELYFFVYGGLGYIALAVGLFFVIWTRNRLLDISYENKPNRLWLAITVLSVSAFYVVGQKVKATPLIAEHNFVLYFSLLHLIFLLIFISLLMGCFTIEFIKKFTNQFRKQLLVCIAIGVVFYGLMRVVWLSWPVLSYGVSRVVYGLLQAFPGDPVLIPPQTISIEGFAVYIGEACSGVFSIFLFSSLYLLLLALDWEKIKHAKAFND